MLACCMTAFVQQLPAQEKIVYDTISDMPQEDLNAIMYWIKNKATSARLPYCYRKSAGRGAGVVGNGCPEGQIKDPNGALCYPKCRDGYYAVGPVCWQSCPGGFRDDGAYCAKPAEYGRGAGYPWKAGDKPFNYDKAKERCEKENPQGCERDGLIYYPKCREGFHMVGCCTCSPNCPPDFGADIGVSCTKKNYPNGAGTVLTCPAGTERDATGGPAGLCYPKCDPGYHGIGPVCWQNCDPGWAECGVGCAQSSLDCATTTIDQVASVLTLAANIATLGLAAPETAAANAGKQSGVVAGKAVTSTSKVGEYFLKAIKMLQNVKPADLPKDASVVTRIIQARTGTFKAATATALKINFTIAKLNRDFYSAYADDFASMTSPEINAEIDRRFNPPMARYLKEYWANIRFLEMTYASQMIVTRDVLSMVSIVDISGVTGVVNAFTKPICQDVISFPNLSQSYAVQALHRYEATP